MSDTGQGGQAPDKGPRAGERLAEARRLRKIPLPDIARDLHLDETKVQALEENRFEVLGAPVFAKGHLRKYAEIVGVSIDTVMDDYRALTDADVAPPVVGEPRRRPREFNLGPWLIAIPLVLAVLGAIYWWLGRTPPRAPRPAPAVSAPLPAPETAPPAAIVQEATRAAEEPPERMQPEADLAEAGGVADNAAPEQAGMLELQLTYSGDCWTEVTDAAGERLFFDLGRQGRTVNVNGQPPLRVLLGDSNNVRLSVNGEPYPIEDAEFRGDTARLTIDN